MVRARGSQMRLKQQLHPPGKRHERRGKGAGFSDEIETGQKSILDQKDAFCGKGAGFSDEIETCLIASSCAVMPCVVRARGSQMRLKRHKWPPRPRGDGSVVRARGSQMRLKQKRRKSHEEYPRVW